MSIYSYTRTFTGEDPDLNVGVLTIEVKSALPGKGFTIKANGTNVDCEFIPALSAEEETILDNTVATHKANQLPVLNDTFEDRYREQEYSNSLLTRETSYAKKEEDGSYSFKVWESRYVYAKHILLNQIEEKFNIDGSIIETNTWTFSTIKIGTNTTVKKEKDND